MAHVLGCFSVSPGAGNNGADVTITSSHWGPHHGPQASMLAGAGGFEFDGYSYPSSPHTGLVADGCVACHMAAPQGNYAGGHTWRMVGV